MSQSFLGRHWKLLVNLATVILLVLLVVLIRGQIIETFKNFGTIEWQVLLIMVPLTWLSYHAQTRMYQRMFSMIGYAMRYKFMFRVALELNFVNQILPSGGVSGISYFGVRMRSAGVAGVQAGLVQIMKLFLLFISFEGLLGIGLLALALEGKANDLMLLVAGSITTLLIVGTIALMTVIGSKQRTHIAVVAIARTLNKLARPFTGRRRDALDPARIEHIVVELHDSYQAMRASHSKLLAPLFWAFVVNLVAVASIYVVYVAFGQWVNVGAVIVAYSVANFAGLVSVLPGGAGIYEALMVGVLAAGGIPPALSLPVTVMYRVLTTLLQVPPGYILYHRNMQRTGATPLDQPHES